MKETMMKLQAIRDVWHEIADQFDDNYTNINSALSELAAVLYCTGNDTTLISAVDALTELLGKYEPFRKRLQCIHVENLTTRGTSEIDYSNISYSTCKNYVGKIVQYVSQLRKEKRFIDAVVPAQLLPGERGVISIGLTCEQNVDSMVKDTSFDVTGNKINVILICDENDFRWSGSTCRTIHFSRGNDSDEIAFSIKALSLGKKIVALRFEQNGITKKVLKITIDVVEKKDREVENTLITEALSSGTKPVDDAVDLELHISTLERDTYSAVDKPTLVFMLNSPNITEEYCYKRVGQITLKSSLEKFREEIHHMMSDLDEITRKNNNGTSTKIDTTLGEFGNHLFRKLFPEELKREYRKWRNKIKTVLIVTDEPWIPWELVKPYDDNRAYGENIDDDFLCMKFNVTRWLPGAQGITGTIPVHSVACLAVQSILGKDRLPGVTKEVEYIYHFYEECSFLAPERPTYEVFENIIASDPPITMWHFAGHGSYNTDSIDESAILLSDGEKITPKYFENKHGTRMKKANPFVFINACWVGQQGWALSKIGGWAAAWLDRCEAGVFIGPMWKVHDECAGEFVKSFYASLSFGKTIGVAVNNARQHLKKNYPMSKDWLAYTVFSHPNTRVVTRTGT